jgi:putative transposase
MKKVISSAFWTVVSMGSAAQHRRDLELEPQIRFVWHEGLCVYGAHKVSKQLNQKKIRAAHCTVARLINSSAGAGRFGARRSR